MRPQSCLLGSRSEIPHTPPSLLETLGGVRRMLGRAGKIKPQGTEVERRGSCEETNVCTFSLFFVFSAEKPSKLTRVKGRSP